MPLRSLFLSFSPLLRPRFSSQSARDRRRALRVEQCCRREMTKACVSEAQRGGDCHPFRPERPGRSTSLFSPPPDLDLDLEKEKTSTTTTI